MTRRALLWVSLLALLAAPLAAADRDDEDHDERDEREDHDERELKVEVGDDKATIKLERHAAGREDSVKIEFDADDAKVKVKHEQEGGDNETEQKLEARFLALVEFVDGDADGAYDAGEAIASAWSLGDGHDAKIPTNGSVSWGSIDVDDVTSGNATGKKLSSRASFGPNATFGLDFYVYGAFALVGNASLAPTEAKIDILLQHYPYVRSDSIVAVLVDLHAKEEIERHGEDDDGLATEASEGPLSFLLTFTWLPNATVDGADVPVHASVLKNKEESDDGEKSQKARVALAYGHGDMILHDPTIGVQYDAASPRPVVPMPGLGLVVAGVAVVAMLTRRGGR